MLSLQRAVRYPIESDDWVETLLIGGVLTLLGFLIVPLFAVYGYLLRVVRARLADEPQPPVFDDWGPLLLEGLQAWVIALVYMLVPLLVAALTVGGAAVAVLTQAEPGIAAGGVLGGLAIVAVLALLFGYVAVAALVNFASEERFGAAFEFETITAVALSPSFAVPWLVSVGVLIAAGLVASVLGLIPILGALAGPFVTFYASVVAAAIWADGFEDATAGGETAGRSGLEESAA